MKINTKTLLIISVVILILVGVVVYVVARKNYIKIPGNGNDVPAGWDPLPAAIKLHSAMSGPGTDELTVYSVLESLSKGQRAVVYNTYLDQYGVSLIADIQDDFSGDELNRVLNYFEGIPGISLKRVIKQNV